MLKKYSSYLLCLLISILVVTLYINDFSPLVQMEWKVQDILYSFRGEPNLSSDIVLINIDDNTLGQYGNWPWHRDKVADLIAAVGSGQPKTILLDLLFDPSVEEDTSGYTDVLAGQMSWTKNVILPYEITRAEFRNSKMANPKYLYNSSLQVNSDLGVLDENSTLVTQKVFLPPEPLCRNAGGLGYKYEIYDSDRKVRWAPLTMYYDGYYYPSAALIASAHFLGIAPSAISIIGGQAVKVGNREIPTNKFGQFFINYNKQGQSFTQISAADILNEKVDFNSLNNKLVIISLNSESVADYYQTPVAASMTSGEKTANIIENIIHSNFMRRMDNSPGTDLLILFALGGIFAFILPRISLLYRLVVLMVCLFMLANLNFVLFNSFRVSIRSLYVALEIFLLFLASPFLDEEFISRFSGEEKQILPKKKKSDAPKLAMPKIPVLERTIKASHPSEEYVETAMLDNTPKKGRVDATTAVSDVAPELRNPSKPSIPNNDNYQEAAPIAVKANDADKIMRQNNETDYSSEKDIKAYRTPISGLDGQPLKNMGRYQIVGELGKGAMGTVYKGLDPAINRYVALKTIRLDFVNDPDELEELKERLYREAQAAGKLSHPNIVTIYDVGNEGTLQYIAMEYLEGQTLEDMIRKKVQFNYKIVAQIITQICSALEYAHSQGIIHRDIKPANIMVLNDYKIRVMDFGIARVDSSSMTRTGIAMGTPNYISPEQLQGKPIDKRTDIFSLGILMYELLVHRRPFRGENLTSLIYNIVNVEPDLPSAIDKAVPLLFDRVVAKALKKNPDERYQRAGDISASLVDFIDSFASKKTMTV
jgi:eukaryotic-like serine/threonine-protein kinase